MLHFVFCIIFTPKVLSRTSPSVRFSCCLDPRTGTETGRGYFSGSYSFSILSAWGLSSEALWKEDVVTGQGPRHRCSRLTEFLSVTHLCHNFSHSAVLCGPLQFRGDSRNTFWLCSGNCASNLLNSHEIVMKCLVIVVHQIFTPSDILQNIWLVIVNQ